MSILRCKFSDFERARPGWSRESNFYQYVRFERENDTWPWGLTRLSTVSCYNKKKTIKKNIASRQNLSQSRSLTTHFLFSVFLWFYWLRPWIWNHEIIYCLSDVTSLHSSRGRKMLNMVIWIHIKWIKLLIIKFFTVAWNVLEC